MTDNFRRLDEEAVTLELWHDETQESLERLRRELAGVRASRDRLVPTGDAERRRIERSLHGGLQQELVALAVKLQLARRIADSSPEDAKALLEEADRDLQHALDATALLADRIYPALLDASGLGAALRAAVTSRGLVASIDVEAGASHPPEITRTIYWCCVEAVERVMGGAKVTVRDEEGALSLEVVGASPGSTSEDLDEAFEWLRARVEALAGRLAIEQGPGDRVRVAGWLPLTR